MQHGGSWGRRTHKAADYARRGEWHGLQQEIDQFLEWKGLLPLRVPWHPRHAPPAATVDSPRIESEARYWAEMDVAQVRRVSWAAIQCLGPMALLAMTDGRTNDIHQLIAETMPVPQHEGLRGLVLGCGDMAGEHAAFLNPRLSFAQIDAWDLNEAVFEQARRVTDGAGLTVAYKLGDVNRIVLPADTYHLIVVFHAYHHFEKVHHIARQINRALAPSGVFFTFDYVGPRRLQQTARQRMYAEMMLAALPERYRRDMHGQIRQQIVNVPPATLSPNEALRSDEILPALRANTRIVWQYNWAGLLYPLLEGIAFNFDEADPVDRALIDYLFNLDKVLCRSGKVEPNFTITLATKR